MRRDKVKTYYGIMNTHLGLGLFIRVSPCLREIGNLGWALDWRGMFG